MLNGIDRDSQVPLHKQVRLYLNDLIARAGTSRMLPPETEIAKSLGISRATVRLAIMDLVREGQLERVPGRGTFIRQGSTRLVFSNWLSAEKIYQPMLQAMIDQFREANTGIDIENLGIQYEHTEHQLMLMTSAGKAPDIGALIYLWLPIFAHQGALRPLENLYPPEIMARIYPQSAAAVSFREHRYAFSWGNAPLILYANRQLVADHLRTDRPAPENYDELMEWFVLLKERTQGTIIPYSIPFQDDEIFFLYSIYNFLIAFGGGVINEDGEIIFNCEENVRSYTWLRGFIAKGCIDVSHGHLENRRLFAFDRLAFMIEGPWLKGVLPGAQPVMPRGMRSPGVRGAAAGAKGHRPLAPVEPHPRPFPPVPQRRGGPGIHPLPDTRPLRLRKPVQAHGNAAGPRRRGGAEPRVRRFTGTGPAPPDEERGAHPLLRLALVPHLDHVLRHGVEGNPPRRCEYTQHPGHLRGTAEGALQEVSAHNHGVFRKEKCNMADPMKITLIGASGFYAFDMYRRVFSDEKMRPVELRIWNRNPKTGDAIGEMLNYVRTQSGIDVKFDLYTDRKEALRGADYVLYTSCVDYPRCPVPGHGGVRTLRRVPPRRGNDVTGRPDEHFPARPAPSRRRQGPGRGFPERGHHSHRQSAGARVRRSQPPLEDPLHRALRRDRAHPGGSFHGHGQKPEGRGMHRGRAATTSPSS